MSKITYPITENYVPDWKSQHAIREVIANGIDAEKVLGAALTVTHDNKKNILTVRNKGTGGLPTSILYFGESSKRGDARQIGQYGEGLKLALLVFARTQCEIVVHNGSDETWKPSLEMDRHGLNCFVMNISKATRKDNDFTVYMHGIDSEGWARIRSMFLKLEPPQKTFPTQYGALIDDPDFVGKLYVRGVYVTTRPNYAFGYDLLRVDTGRDRSIPSSWDLDAAIAAIWDEVVKNGGATIKKSLFRALEIEAAEQDVFTYRAPPELVDALVATFKETHGEETIPVVSSAEGTNLDHLGIKTVAVPQRMSELLRKKLATPEAARKNFHEQITERFTLQDLDASEEGNYIQALGLLAERIPDANTRVTIVTFGSEHVHGLHRGKEVYVARHVLAKFGKLVMVLIHEFAHDFGYDASLQHVRAMEDMSEEVIEKLAKAAFERD